MTFDTVALRRALKRLPQGTAVKMNIFGKLSVYAKDGAYMGFIDPQTSRFELGHKPMAKRHKRMLKLLFVLLGSALLASHLTACSFGVYSGEKSTLVGVELGTRSAFEGLVHHRDAETFDLSIQSRQKDSAAGLSAIIEGVVKGVK